MNKGTLEAVQAFRLCYQIASHVFVRTSCSAATSLCLKVFEDDFALRDLPFSITRGNGPKEPAILMEIHEQGGRPEVCE